MLNQIHFQSFQRIILHMFTDKINAFNENILNKTSFIIN